MKTLEKVDRSISRPLKVLVPLIKQDIRDGEEAGTPYFAAAGEKLLEAKPQVPHGEWEIWVRKNFNRTQQTVGKWMKLAKHKLNARVHYRPPRTLSEFTEPNRDKGHRPKWHAPVAEALKRAHPHLTSKPAEAESRETEGSKKRALAIELIDIGYRILATKLHPDKGGKNGDGMQRLNEVRAVLKRLASHEW